MRNFLHKISFLVRLAKSFAYDFKRYFTYSSSLDNENSVLINLVMLVHIVEKGLIIPPEKFRLGFGSKHLSDIFICLDKLVINKEDLDSRIEYVFQILKLYLATHQKINSKFKIPCQDGFEKYKEYIEKAKLIQIPIISNKDYEKSCEMNFADFCHIRHSIRDFSNDKISQEEILDAIKLAQCAPSACNRQNPKIIVIRDKSCISQVMNLQQGGRTFSDKIDTLFIVCSDLEGYWYANERRCSLLDAGLFAMQLVNGLLYKGIGSCVLHWSVLPSKDKMLRETITIPPNWEVALFIAAGKLPNSVSVCPAIRRSPQDIMMIME